MPNFLKRLELNGFKSFAGKTVLEFPAGIVAVVGPNGSGKSNIVDALRWLLGEREAKNLRGGRVEDLIFAGTQKRARAGMAAASLHFENREKFFPVDFEEVAVTRQVSRGGESKYFLNKSEVLLRDLVDFFAKARMGSRGLIIIGQGDSDLFIRSSPAERREMIEELLGLREYQLKKADAERRLAASRINLDKTKALAGEILPHLRSLRRQAGRWERRGALEEELRGLESRYFGFQLGEIAEKSRAADERVAAGRREWEALEKERRGAEARQAEIEARRPEEKQALAAVRGEIRALAEKRSALQKDIGRIEAQAELMETAARGAPAAARGGISGAGIAADRLFELLQTVKRELEHALEGEPIELHAAVENILEEIGDVLSEAPAVAEGGAKGTAAGGAAAAELKARLGALAKDLEALDAGLAALREKERAFEEGQEGFYAEFKAAVAAVAAARDRIGEWEAGSRERTMEKERLVLRREEIVRQISQAGRNPAEFAPAEKADAAGTRAADAAAKMGAPELAEMERRIMRLRGELAAIGEVDEALMKEARETEERYSFLARESEDLAKAVADLGALMQELSEKVKVEFAKSLAEINGEFGKFFALMFGGGAAKLTLERPRAPKRQGGEGGGAEGDSETPEEAGKSAPDGIGTDGAAAGIAADESEFAKDPGVNIEVRLPRKKIASLDMLSGGERSLVGIAALFAMVSVSPPPFLVLDEIDAPLDERNARRFGEMLKEFSKKTQFIVVTHNRATMEAADILYGVTLGEDGASKVVSLKLESA